MLSDRPYLQGEYQREKTSALTWLLSAMIGGFVLQVMLSAKWFGGAGGQLDNLLGLTLPGIQNGWIWTLVTHSFLHSTSFIFHVVGNCLALYFIGRELIPMLGTKRFLGLYAGATIIGGLAWTAVHWRFGMGSYVGATAAVSALVVVFACFFPNQRMNFLLLFIFPVTLRPKHIAFAFAGFDLLALMIYEFPHRTLPFEWNIAGSAHLGGMLTGLFYYRFMHDARWFNREDRSDVELPRWLTRSKAASEALALSEPLPRVPDSSPRDIRIEVDRVLDKINSQGLGSLTPAERRVLDDAKKLLSHP